MKLSVLVLLAAALVALLPAGARAGVPSEMVTQRGDQTPGQFPAMPSTPALTTIPPPPAAPASTADIPADEFPSDAPKAPPSSSPPPLSPSGRWLHSATLIDGKMYVYGGVGSYSTALYNDMWVYNFVEREWSELQASFVPPFPVDNAASAKKPEQATLEMFRPADAPAQPPLKEDPSQGPITVSVHPPRPKNGGPAIDPVYKAPTSKPLPILAYETLPYRNDKPAGYSFLQTDEKTAEYDFF